jgi:hypothetical protein
MWSGTSTYINGNIKHLSTLIQAHSHVVTFEPESQGQVAMVIYEWADSGYLGKVIDPNADYLPVSCLDIATRVASVNT